MRCPASRPSTARVQRAKSRPLNCHSRSSVPFPQGRDGERGRDRELASVPPCSERLPSLGPLSAAPQDWLCSPDRWWGAQLVCYQPSPGASLSYSVAASLRLGPRGSLSAALAWAQPPFPPSSGQAGRWEPAIRIRGSGACSFMPLAPSQGRNMGFREGQG